MKIVDAIVALSSSPDIRPQEIIDFIELNKQGKELGKKLKFVKKEEIITRELSEEKSAKLKAALLRIKATALFYFDSDYPRELRELPDKPAVLYLRGNNELLKEKAKVAIVGSRRATSYGLSQTLKFSRELAESGITIVSGLALGIDAQGHRGALEVNGKTIAVLGTAIDTMYPATNGPLARKILDSNGLIISEFPPGYPTFKFNFPLRNRIVAGLSQAACIMEAHESSGALITALLALDYNKEVFALPGDINKLGSVGANNLIKQGAQILLDPLQILELFNISKAEKMAENLEPTEAEVYNAVASGENNFDRILKSLKYSTQDLNQILMALELKGIIKQDQKGSIYLTEK